MHARPVMLLCGPTMHSEESAQSQTTYARLQPSAPLKRTQEVFANVFDCATCPVLCLLILLLSRRRYYCAPAQDLALFYAFLACCIPLVWKCTAALHPAALHNITESGSQRHMLRQDI